MMLYSILLPLIWHSGFNGEKKKDFWYKANYWSHCFIRRPFLPCLALNSEKYILIQTGFRVIFDGDQEPTAWAKS